MSASTPNSDNSKTPILPFNALKIVYVNSEDPATATIFDLTNPPAVNNESLKTDSRNLYTSTDSKLWRYVEKTGLYDTYKYPFSFKHKMFARKSTTQAGITGFGADVVNWDTPITDTASAFNKTTGVYTIPKSGFYMASAKLQMTGGWGAGGVLVDTTNCRATIMTSTNIVSNSSLWFQISRTSIADSGIPVLGPVYLAAGATVKVMAAHSQGGTRALAASALDNRFEIWEI